MHLHLLTDGTEAISIAPTYARCALHNLSSPLPTSLEEFHNCSALSSAPMEIV